MGQRGRGGEEEESPLPRGPGCSRPEGGVCSQHVRARGAPPQTKPDSGEAAAGGPVRAHPRREALPRDEGPRGGDGCARTGSSPPMPPFCFLGTMGESNGRARERGWREGNEPGARARGPGRGGERGAPSALSPRHLSQDRAEGEDGRGRGKGGSRPSRRHIGAYLVGVPFPDRSRRRPPTTARRGLPPKATRCAPGC